MCFCHFYYHHVLYLYTVLIYFNFSFFVNCYISNYFFLKFIASTNILILFQLYLNYQKQFIFILVNNNNTVTNYISDNCVLYLNVTLEHKTSHKGQFCEIEMCASSERWINNLSIDVWFGQYLKIWNLRVQKNIEKIIFKLVQMKFLPVSGKVTFKSNALQYCVTP